MSGVLCELLSVVSQSCVELFAIIISFSLFGHLSCIRFSSKWKAEMLKKPICASRQARAHGGGIQKQVTRRMRTKKKDKNKRGTPPDTKQSWCISAFVAFHSFHLLCTFHFKTKNIVPTKTKSNCRFNLVPRVVLEFYFSISTCLLKPSAHFVTMSLGGESANKAHA